MRRKTKTVNKFIGLDLETYVYFLLPTTQVGWVLVFFSFLSIYWPCSVASKLLPHLFMARYFINMHEVLSDDSVQKAKQERDRQKI